MHDESLLAIQASCVLKLELLRMRETSIPVAVSDFDRFGFDIDESCIGKSFFKMFAIEHAVPFLFEQFIRCFLKLMIRYSTSWTTFQVAAVAGTVSSSHLKAALNSQH
jgi:hypothetical protein